MSQGASGALPARLARRRQCQEAVPGVGQLRKGRVSPGTFSSRGKKKRGWNLDSLNTYTSLALSSAVIIKKNGYFPWEVREGKVL